MHCSMEITDGLNSIKCDFLEPIYYLVLHGITWIVWIVITVSDIITSCFVTGYLINSKHRIGVNSLYDMY